MKNFKLKRMISIVVMVSLFLALVFLIDSAQATELGDVDTGFETPDVEEPEDEEDLDILEEYGGLLTGEQLAALEAAFIQMKDSVTLAESVYQDAIKALKDKYRDAVQDAVKSIDNEEELAAVIDQIKAEILSEYETVQKTFDGDVSAARDSFRKAADEALIPAEIIEAVAAWHVNKELNAADELTNYVESYRNLSGNTGNGQGKALGGENAQKNVNSEQNQETNQNKNEQKNTEKKQQQEQNEEGDQSQTQQQGQSQSSNGKGKK